MSDTDFIYKAISEGRNGSSQLIQQQAIINDKSKPRPSKFDITEIMHYTRAISIMMFGFSVANTQVIEKTDKVIFQCKEEPKTIGLCCTSLNYSHCEFRKSPLPHRPGLVTILKFLLSEIQLRGSPFMCAELRWLRQRVLLRQD